MVSFILMTEPGRRASRASGQGSRSGRRSGKRRCRFSDDAPSASAENWRGRAVLEAMRAACRLGRQRDRPAFPPGDASISGDQPAGSARGSPEEHGALLCAVHRTDAVRDAFAHPALGPHRIAGAGKGASFREGSGCRPAVPRPAAPKARPRLSGEVGRMRAPSTDAPARHRTWLIWETARSRLAVPCRQARAAWCGWS